LNPLIQLENCNDEPLQSTSINDRKGSIANGNEKGCKEGYQEGCKEDREEKVG
jgi:hypothetical protein